MCARYIFTPGECDEIDRIVREVSRELNEQIKCGEIFPSDRAPIGRERFGTRRFGLCKWGFPSPTGKGILVNARAESADKPMFRESVLFSRCIVPATGFFEWSKGREKQKFLFRLPGEPMFYLGGLVKSFGNEERFVVVTSPANDSMRDIHDRMPVILAPNEAERYLFDTEFAFKTLESRQPALTCESV